MLIWLGVVGTILSMVGLGMMVSAYMLIGIVRECMDDWDSKFNLEDSSRKEFTRAIERVFANSVHKLEEQTQRANAAFELTAKSVNKSHDDMATNLSALLREINISKQMAEAGMGLAQQGIEAINYLRTLAEAIKSGPRTPSITHARDENPTDMDRDQFKAIMSMIGERDQSDGIE